MDPLSDVLSILKPRSYMSGGIDVGGALSLRYSEYVGIKCYAVASGRCWLTVEGVPDPICLEAGDCFLLPRGRPFCLATDLGLAPVDFMTILPTAKYCGGVVTINGGGDCFIVGGHFALDGEQAGVLLGILPPVVRLREESGKAALRWSLERMREELRDQQPGSLLVAQHLAQMMLVQALRLHLAEGTKGGVGWLFALADPQMGAAIGALHGDPARRWTLQDLADLVGLSRSTFALKFKETVGSSPMEYLTRWRMLLAADRLANSGEPISAIALSLGYESESAFGTAFKRVMGRSPRQYGRARKPASIPQGHPVPSEG